MSESEKYKPVTVQEMIDMKLHDHIYPNGNLIIHRAPGGWIYESCSVNDSTSLCFVPIPGILESKI